MQPYDVTYKVGRYENTIIIQADNPDRALTAAWDSKAIPPGAEIVSVKAKG